MSFNRSPLAFDDARAVLDKALDTKKGLKIPCSSRGAAIQLRSRFNYYRKLDRAESKNLYDQDHPMFGRSAYDRLVLRIPPKGEKDDATLYIEPHSVEKLTIEEIV